ncbi:MAG TPA: GGDEF domain-containing protein [Myxococcales bacterium]|nr:GGDEF domain-containing protein [Myxococcales bacterium]
MPRTIERLEKTTVAPAPQRSAMDKSPFLLILSGPQVGELHRLTPELVTVIGRGDADLRVRDDGVSRRHCSIQPRERGALLLDLGSANGTFVDGERVGERLLSNDDRFQIGTSTTFKFSIADELEAAVQRKLVEAALREPLTGLYNRRHFQERFAAEVAVAHRHRRPLSLLLVDVDHFKRVNDKHGHLAGDEVLKTVAQALTQGLRIEDILARFGGEEFVVLAREADAAAAMALAERLRQLVEAAQTPWEGGEGIPAGVSVTVSIGVAQLAPEENDRDLFQRADGAAYQAKKLGRNRVLLAEPPPSKRSRTAGHEGS